LVDGGLFRRQS